MDCTLFKIVICAKIHSVSEKVSLDKLSNFVTTHVRTITWRSPNVEKILKKNIVSLIADHFAIIFYIEKKNKSLSDL